MNIYAVGKVVTDLFSAGLDLNQGVGLYKLWMLYEEYKVDELDYRNFINSSILLQILYSAFQKFRNGNKVNISF